MSNYRNLIAWQKSMLLVEETYKLIKCLPKEEMFALTDQIRRAVISIPSNIAEGHGRDTEREFRHFLSIAQGSRAELETHLEIGRRLGYFSDQQTKEVLILCAEIDKILYTLIRNLQT